MRKLLRTRAAQKIVDQLIPAEAALDEALASISRLIETSITARIDSKMPLSCGHGAIKGMSSVVGLITQARGELVEVHAELAATKILVGLGAVSYGDAGGCPSPSADHSLAVVSLAS